MLSLNSGTLQEVTDKQQQNSEIRRIILRTSSELVKCRSDEVAKISQQALVDLMKIEHIEQAGWFFLDESGSLQKLLDSTCGFPSFCLAFGGSLNRLPWCLDRLSSGKAVIIESLADLPSTAKVDQQFLKGYGVRSFALIPSNSLMLGRTLMVLLSISSEINWSEGIVEQYTLLQNILSSSYQRRLADKESKATTEQFHRLFVSSTTAMAMFNHSGRFISTNEAFCSILGYSENQLRRMKYEDIIHLTDHCDKASFLKYLSSPTLNQDHTCELSLIHKDLSLMQTRIKVRSIERYSLQESCFLISIEDLTGHKIFEHEPYRIQAEISNLATQLIQSQENERKRLSRELHDDIGQRLSLVASEIALLASQCPNVTYGPGNCLGRLRDELDELCTDVHQMSHNLHSSKLQHLGLKSALKDLCRRLSQPDFRVDLRIDEFEEPISEEVALCLYRVVQESLNNALKHAHTLIVAVTITKLQKMFYMTIQDSGIGFDSSTSSRGLGLLSMSERLRLVNGHIRLHSIPGRGTEIWIDVPDEQNILQPSILTAADNYQCR